ncbi:unnamed protein product [Arctogadus glacialis]
MTGVSATGTLHKAAGVYVREMYDGSVASSPSRALRTRDTSAAWLRCHESSPPSCPVPVAGRVNYSAGWGYGLNVLTRVPPGLGVIPDQTRAKHPLAELVQAVLRGATVGAEQRTTLLGRGRRPIPVPSRQPLQEKSLEVPRIGPFS